MNLKRPLKRFFCTLSGDDYGIVCQCGPKLESRFALIGAFVLLVFILCFVSSYFSFIKLFPNYWVGIPISLFFAWMITNIYLLLLYTLSKNVIPRNDAPKSRFFSIAIRVLFICFIAVIVSKPIESVFFAAALEQEITEFKEQKITDYAKATEDFFSGEAVRLKSIIEKQNKKSMDFGNERIEKYQRLLAEKENQKTIMIKDMQNLVMHSNFYIQGIVILNTKYPECWLFTFVCISIFLAPAALKNFISEKSDYYTLKRRIETELVRGEYISFKAEYRRIFHERFGAAKDYSEHFLDAPFNTIPKIDDVKFLNERDLINNLYDA